MGEFAIKAKVLGNYAPNYRALFGFPGSSYYLKGMESPVILDFGMGVFRKAFFELKKDKKKLSQTTFILSHNHIDHSLSVIPLTCYLLGYNLSHYLRKDKEKIKVSIFLPKRSIIYSFVQLFSCVFDIHIIDEETHFERNGYSFSFCRTEHKGESYATKIQKENKRFIYTSDIAYVNDKLEEFCKDADCVLLDSGHPKKEKAHTLKGYHGKTEEILNNIKDCQVNRILASHLKREIKEEEYIKVFPQNADVTLVKMDQEYNIL